MSIFARLIYSLAFGSLMIVYAQAASLPTRFSAKGYASDYMVGEADWMWPVMSNQEHILYIDPSIGYGSDDQGYADVGLGYHWTNKKARLWVFIYLGVTRVLPKMPIYGWRILESKPSGTVGRHI